MRQEFFSWPEVFHTCNKGSVNAPSEAQSTSSVFLLRLFSGARLEMATLSLQRLSLIRQRVSKCRFIVQELCESRGGRPGLSVLTSLLVSVDVKLY